LIIRVKDKQMRRVMRRKLTNSLKRKKRKLMVLTFSFSFSSPFPWPNFFFFFFSLQDPDEFSVHFGDEFSNDVKESIDLFQGNNEKWTTQSEDAGKLGTVTVYDVLEVDPKDLKPSFGATLDDFFVGFPNAFQVLWQKSEKSPSLNQVKKKLHPEWIRANQASISAKEKESQKVQFTELQRNLFHYITKYKDLMFTGRNSKNANQIRRLYCLHALNHAFK